MGRLIKLWEYNLSVRDFLKRIFRKYWELFGLARSIYFWVNLNNVFLNFYDVVFCTYCFLEGTDRERLQLSLACEQALLLGESQEVTREPHAKGDASARGPLSRAFSRGFLRLPLEIESLLARRLTFFKLGGSVAEWSARRTRNAALPGSSSALSSATLVTFPKPIKACFLRLACRRFQCSRRLEPFRKAEPLIFKHWSVPWPPTHLLVELSATILDKTV